MMRRRHVAFPMGRLLRRMRRRCVCVYVAFPRGMIDDHGRFDEGRMEGEERKG